MGMSGFKERGVLTERWEWEYFGGSLFGRL
jgi:hypothetical protein